MVCSGFLMGSQFSMGRGTLGTTAFFKGTPIGPPPIGGGGGTVEPDDYIIVMKLCVELGIKQMISI